MARPVSDTARIGHGYDLHRLEPGLPLIVCGERLEHDRGCAAHSDGDVVYHAVVDAILGALGGPDIGQLFDNADPRWKGADSSVFMAEAVKRLDDAEWAIGNLDVTVILERPKLGPHKGAMRANLVKLLRTPVGRVNLKAKTNEGVDAVGEGRAIACHAVVVLQRLRERD